MRKELSSYRKDLQKLMDAAEVELGKQTRIEEILRDIARAAGVQANDLLLVGEFDDDNGQLLNTFVGIYDPRPGEARKLMSFEELMDSDWQPPNRVTR